MKIALSPSKDWEGKDERDLINSPLEGKHCVKARMKGDLVVGKKSKHSKIILNEGMGELENRSLETYEEN